MSHSIRALSDELAEVDAYLPARSRETIGMAVGIRPYVVSWATGLKSRG